MHNGIDTFLGEFTYVVAIADKIAIRATGGIIDEYHILTSAHPAVDNNTNAFRPFSFKIIAGTNNALLAEPLRIVVDIEKVHIPLEYNARVQYFEDDIAVVNLRIPLDLSQTNRLQAMKLASVNYRNVDGNEYVNQRGVVAGFGMSINNEPVPTNQLLKLYVKILDQLICMLLSQSSKILCVQVDNRYDNIPSGVCYDDSGPPLVNEDGIAIAIVRGGVGPCDQNNMPAYYTKIAPHLDFIRNAVAGRMSGMRVGTYRQSPDVSSIINL